MFKRSRRTTVCKVEQLEGRVVPSAIVSKADVVGISSPILHLNGYTTFPVKPGETIDLVVVQIRNQSPITIAGRPTRVVVQPTSHPGDSGSFGAGIHVANDAQRFYPDGRIELSAGILSKGPNPHVIERYYSEIAVTRD